MASKNDLELVLAFGEEDFGDPQQEFEAWNDVKFSVILRNVADHPVLANAQSEYRIRVLVWSPTGVEAFGHTRDQVARLGQERVELSVGGTLKIPIDFSRFYFSDGFGRYEPAERGQYTVQAFSLDYRIYSSHDHFWIGIG